MTKEEILQTFSDINYAYNNCSKYDTLKRMLDELTEPCEDAISRQEVLDYLDKMPSELTSDGRRVVRRRTLEEYISDTLPPVTPQQKMGRWIPVSERLPEEYCLFCDIDGDVLYGHIYDGRWWAEGQDDRIKNVIAWMPLPEPYKGGE